VFPFLANNVVLAVLEYLYHGMFPTISSLVHLYNKDPFEIHGSIPFVR
jgi:hypothetical protein